MKFEGDMMSLGLMMSPLGFEGSQKMDRKMKKRKRKSDVWVRISRKLP
jgi:hypothetical protein